MFEGAKVEGAINPLKIFRTKNAILACKLFKIYKNVKISIFGISVCRFSCIVFRWFMVYSVWFMLRLGTG